MNPTKVSHIGELDSFVVVDADDGDGTVLFDICETEGERSEGGVGEKRERDRSEELRVELWRCRCRRQRIDCIDACWWRDRGPTKPRLLAFQHLIKVRSEGGGRAIIGELSYNIVLGVIGRCNNR